MKRIFALVLFFAICLTAIADNTPIRNGLLQGPLNANQYPITNASLLSGPLSGTNIIPQSLPTNAFSAASIQWIESLASSGTNGIVTGISSVIDANALNVKSFGALGNGRMLVNCSITASSTTLNCATAGFTIADVGKVVSVVNAGVNSNALTAIVSSYVSASQVNLSVAASTSQGANYAVIGSDDTTAIQSALNAIADQPQGGTLVFPQAIYIVNGTLQDPSPTNTHHSAQIIIPEISDATHPKVIKMLGIGSVVGRYPAAWDTNGSMIWSTIVTNYGNVIECSNPNNPAYWSGIDNVGADGNIPFNPVYVQIENMRFRCVEKPDITCINLAGAQTAAMKDVYVDCGPNEYGDLQPTNATSCGIKLPSASNYGGGSLKCENVIVFGFYNGFAAYEHAELFNCAAIDCWFAYFFPGGGHTVSLHNCNAEGCHFVTGAHDWSTTIDAEITVEHSITNGVWTYPCFAANDNGAMAGVLKYTWTSQFLSQFLPVTNTWNGASPAGNLNIFGQGPYTSGYWHHTPLSLDWIGASGAGSSGGAIVANGARGLVSTNGIYLGGGNTYALAIYQTNDQPVYIFEQSNPGITNNAWQFGVRPEASENGDFGWMNKPLNAPGFTQKMKLSTNGALTATSFWGDGSHLTGIAGGGSFSNPTAATNTSNGSYFFLGSNYWGFTMTNGTAIAWTNGILTSSGPGSTNTSWFSNEVASGWIAVSNSIYALSFQGTVGTSNLTGVLNAAQFPALTGDVTTPGGSLATTLATVNGTVGTYGDSTHTAQLTVNGKGLVTSAASVAITPTSLPSGTNNGDEIIYHGGSWLVYPVGEYVFQGTTTNSAVSNLSTFVTSKAFFAVPNGYSARIRGDFQAAGSTNSAGWTKSAQFRNNGATLSLLQSNQIAGPTTGQGTNWNCQYVVNSTNILLQAIGDTAETVDWQWEGRIELLTNATQIAGAGGGGGTTNLTTNLVASYRMEEVSGTRVDSWINGLNLTDGSNNVSFATNTIAGGTNGANMGGLNGTLYHVDDSHFQVGGNQDFTFEWWFNRSGSSAVNIPIIYKGGTTWDGKTQEYWCAVDSTGHMEIGVGNGTTFNRCAWGTAITDSSWHQAVAWYDHTAQTLNISVDNGTTVTVSYTGGTQATTGSAFCVFSKNGGGVFYTKELDQIRMWDRVLTSGERSSIWGSGSGLADSLLPGTP